MALSLSLLPVYGTFIGTVMARYHVDKQVVFAEVVWSEGSNHMCQQ